MNISAKEKLTAIIGWPGSFGEINIMFKDKGKIISMKINPKSIIF